MVRLTAPNPRVPMTIKSVHVSWATSTMTRPGFGPRSRRVMMSEMGICKGTKVPGMCVWVILRVIILFWLEFVYFRVSASPLCLAKTKIM